MDLYLEDHGLEIGRESVPKNGLDKNAQTLDVNPTGVQLSKVCFT